MTRRHPASPAITAAEIRAAASSEYGLTLRELVPTDGGWDGAAALWWASDEAGGRWAIKTTRRDVEFGLRVAATMADAGSAGIAAPHRTLDGRSWVRIGGRILTLTPWVEGADAIDAGVDWAALGRVLRAVHDQPPPPTAPVRRGVRRYGKGALALLRDVDELVARLPEGPPLREEMRRRWPEVRARLAVLADAERRLKRSRTPAARVTLHGDPHLGNVVVDADGRPWLIDFDEATVAPREVDLMLVELGVLFSRPITADERAAFRVGYGRDAVIDEFRIARFGCVRAIEDVTSSVAAALQADVAVQIDYASFVGGMLGPDGLVTLVETDLQRLGVLRPQTEE